MTDAQPYSIPKEPGRWRAFALALAVHGALVALLWFSVHWQNETPVAIEAEVWSTDVRAAAPPPPPPPPPEPEPEVQPPPQLKAPPPPPKPQEIEPPAVKPDIALEIEKKRKEKLQKEKRDQEQKARLEKQKADKEEASLKKLADEKEAARIEKLEKQAAEKKRIEKEKADAAAKKRAADAKQKLAEEARIKQEQADDAQRKKARDEDLKRMMAQAGSGGSGDAPKSQGAQGDPGYAGKVAAKIRANTVFNVPANLSGNPSVEYAVGLLPDGSLRRPIRKIRSSGIPGFDEAVLNAIEKSEPFPADKSGKVPDSVNIVHKPKD